MNFPEKYRVDEEMAKRHYNIGRLHLFVTKHESGNGAFLLPRQGKTGAYYFCIASNGDGWEHVSVTIPSSPKTTPSWDEMCYIKSMFWDEGDCVIQYHPAKKDYISMHDHCLHLWKPVNDVLPVPDSLLVGLKKAAV